MTERTIAAVSTPYGKGGVALIRVSGEKAVQICENVFSRKNKIKLADTASNHAVYGDIYHENEMIDDGIAVVYRTPHSYTGEDVVEITCHGGILLTKLTLESALLNGAEPAEAGEFTKKAFLNGKMGLIGAETVMNLIEAESKEKLKFSSSPAGRNLELKIAGLYEEIRFLLSGIYAFIDFPDEDLSDVTADELLCCLKKLVSDIDAIIKTYKTGRALNEGILTVIAGKPNTGKSSLLNLLAGENRAIVTDIAGTTRDIIEETVSLGKVLLRLCDTAGIRPTSDAVEKIGVERAVGKLDEAELVMFVLDSSEELDENDLSLAERLKNSGKTVIAVVNKSDLRSAIDLDYIKNTFPHTVALSAVNGEGADTLIKTIEDIYLGHEIDYGSSIIVASARQYASLKNAREYILDGIDALENGFTQDVACIGLESAMAKLGEIDGGTVTAEIIHEIFSRFCVGK